MSQSDAFAVGYGLNLVGTWFDGGAMLVRCAADDAPAAVAAAARSQLDALSHQATATQAQVRRIERALAAAGVEAPAGPDTPDSYQPWAEAVANAYYATLSDDDAGAYALGSYLGSWVLSANLLSMALYLQTEGDSPTVDWYVATCGAALADAVAGAEASTGGRPGADAAVATMRSVDLASEDCLEALQGALATLTGRIDALQASLA